LVVLALVADMMSDLGRLAQSGIPESGQRIQGRFRQRIFKVPRRAHSGRVLRFRKFLAVWAAVSAIWMAGAIYNIYQRVDEQAAMSADVEHDLDASLSPSSCSGLCTATFNAADAPDRLDIASTYLRFGSMEMGECVFGPPLALLLVGLGAFSALRRRRRSGIN
jgi:uncharacterized protein (TIGR03382 family)